MYYENKKTVVKSCTMVTLIFDILLFGISLVACGLVHGYCSDYDGYIGGIMEMVVAILCIVLISLSFSLLANDGRKVKDLACGLVVFICITLVFVVAGMVLIIYSGADIGEGLLSAIIAFLITFIAFVINIVSLAIACSTLDSMNTNGAIGMQPIYTRDALMKMLRDYKVLHECGMITHDEYYMKRAQILRKLGM